MRRYTLGVTDNHALSDWEHRWNKEAMTFGNTLEGENGAGENVGKIEEF